MYHYYRDRSTLTLTLAIFYGYIVYARLAIYIYSQTYTRVARPCGRIQRGRPVKRRIDPARISEVTHYIRRPEPIRLKCQPALPTRLASSRFNNIHLYVHTLITVLCRLQNSKKKEKKVCRSWPPHTHGHTWHALGSALPLGTPLTLVPTQSNTVSHHDTQTAPRKARTPCYTRRP